jgi:hypothetical protein
MHITNFLGDNLGLIYTTDDRWFEDVSFFIKEAHKHKVDLDSEIDALEIVSPIYYIGISDLWIRTIL